MVSCEYDIFSLEKHDMGHTNATKHKIFLKDLDTPRFKERFCRTPPPQLDEVREHLKLMLDAGVVQPSNVGCWSSPTEQQPLVQCCCPSEKERRITPFLHQLQKAQCSDCQRLPPSASHL